MKNFIIPTLSTILATGAFASEGLPQVVTSEVFTSQETITETYQENYQSRPVMIQQPVRYYQRPVQVRVYRPAYCNCTCCY